MRGRQCIRARPLEYRDRYRRIEIEIGIRTVVQRSQLDSREVLDADYGVRILLDDDIAELVWISQPAECLHRNLECAGLVHRRLIEGAGRDLDVLPLQRRHHVICGQPQRLHPVGIEPDPHGIVAAAEHDERTDAIDACQSVLDFDRGVVGDEQRVARFVGREQMHDHHQVGRTLGHGDADIAHVSRQARLRDGDPVLHLNLRDIEVGADVEGDRDREFSVRGRIRRHVKHVLDAVDLLLDRCDYRRGDHVGARTRILTAHIDDGRSDFRILRDRQPRKCDAAKDHEYDRDHGGEDRPVDEEMRNAHGLVPPVISTVAAGRRWGLAQRRLSPAPAA